jgi:hypothetical protein
MILEIVFGAVGMLVGYVISIAARDEEKEEKYRKTLEQVDAVIRKDLEYYKNLSSSLKEDVRYYREKLERNTKK